jgi:hypothetical protein
MWLLFFSETAYGGVFSPWVQREIIFVPREQEVEPPWSITLQNKIF